MALTVVLYDADFASVDPVQEDISNQYQLQFDEQSCQFVCSMMYHKVMSLVHSSV